MATKNRQPKLTRRACGAMAAHMALLERYPGFRTRQQRLEGENARRRALGILPAELKLAKIKVVVHVVYKDTSQNISDAQINSQIKVLNLDFRAKNSDKKKTPCRMERPCGRLASRIYALQSHAHPNDAIVLRNR